MTTMRIPHTEYCQRGIYFDGCCHIDRVDKKVLCMCMHIYAHAVHVCVLIFMHEHWIRNWIYINGISFLMSYVYLHIIYGLQYLKRLLLAMLCCCRVCIHVYVLFRPFFPSRSMYVFHEMCVFCFILISENMCRFLSSFWWWWCHQYEEWRHLLLKFEYLFDLLYFI